jgi:hypothetical protein
MRLAAPLRKATVLSGFWTVRRTCAMREILIVRAGHRVASANFGGIALLVRPASAQRGVWRQGGRPGLQAAPVVRKRAETTADFSFWSPRSLMHSTGSITPLWDSDDRRRRRLARVHGARVCIGR